MVAVSGAIDWIDYDPIQNMNTIYFTEPTSFTLKYGEHTSVPIAYPIAQKVAVTIQLSPNPCVEKLNIQIDGLSKAETLLIEWFDLKGRLLQQRKEQLQSNSSLLEMEVADFPVGTYLLTLTGESFQKSRKVVVSRGDG